MVWAMSLLRMPTPNRERTLILIRRQILSLEVARNVWAIPASGIRSNVLVPGN